MRTDKELIQLMLDNLDKEFIGGVCMVTVSLRLKSLITREEEKKIELILHDSLPPKKFGPSEMYCWSFGDIEPRREFLQNILNKLS